MAKQYARRGDYGRVQAFLASTKRTTVVGNRAFRQAFNRLYCKQGQMRSRMNGSRVNIYFDHPNWPIIEATKLKDGSGNWVFEKCGR